MAEQLDLEDIIDRIAEYEGWEQDGAWLVKRFEFDDFAAAIDFVNEVADAAEDLNHHPDITVQNYDEVILAVTTHEAGGITDKDFDFVDRVEQLL
ncbi:MAG: 4a-hydroxytetrahydrobiopterin dehydratase [Candidatus Nanohaloarchaea archaeon]